MVTPRAGRSDETGTLGDGIIAGEPIHGGGVLACPMHEEKVTSVTRMPSGIRFVEVAMMWGWDGWMHGYGWLVGLASWIVIVLGAVLAAALWGARKRFGRDAGEDGGAGETPLEILRKRYARGDISREEFEQVRRELV